MTDLDNTSHDSDVNMFDAVNTAGTKPSEPSASAPAQPCMDGVLDQLGGLFRFPAPMHRPRPKGCMWCEPGSEADGGLRFQDAVAWVLHVLAEHIPAELLHAVNVQLESRWGKAEVRVHGYTWEQVCVFAEALDLFANDVHDFEDGDRRFTVVSFGGGSDPVRMAWFTRDDSEAFNVKRFLTRAWPDWDDPLPPVQGFGSGGE